MIKDLCVLFSVLLLTACQSIPQQRVLEAKQMSRDVALATVDRYTPRGFSSQPSLPRSNSTSSFCTDKSPKNVRFEDLSIRWGLNEVTVFSAYEPVISLWCGKNVRATFRVPDLEERENLVNALIFLGAKPNITD